MLSIKVWMVGYQTSAKNPQGDYLFIGKMENRKYLIPQVHSYLLQQLPALFPLLIQDCSRKYWNFLWVI